MRGLIIGAAALGILGVAEAGGSAYFYKRTMKRSRAKKERTMKMAGTDWNQYMELLRERRESLVAHPCEDVYITSGDGLKLHATYFPGDGNRRLVICLHGYTGEGMKDFIGLSDYYLRKGFQMLLLDARSHGESEGEYIGFGCLDRRDLLQWISWSLNKCGRDMEILLHGISMGGATALMASGLKLPHQVKGIISDCGFTSPREVFSHVLKNMYHMPPFPMIQISDAVNRRKAGYGLDDCNAAREVRNAKVPVLLIHGNADTFVPCSMCYEIYENCASDKEMLVIEGAAHAESYYKDMPAYEEAMDRFIHKTLETVIEQRLLKGVL